MAFYDCQASTKRKQSAGWKSNCSKDCSRHVSEYCLSLVLFCAWNFLGKYCWEGKCTSKEPAVASVYPHIQVGSFELKAFSKLRTSLSSCLWGTKHTLGWWLCLFPSCSLAEQSSCSLGGSWCFLLTALLSVLQHLTNSAKWLLRWDHSWPHLAHATLHPEVVSGLLVASTSGPKGFQGLQQAVWTILWEPLMGPSPHCFSSIYSSRTGLFPVLQGSLGWQPWHWICCSGKSSCYSWTFLKSLLNFSITTGHGQKWGLLKARVRVIDPSIPIFHSDSYPWKWTLQES